MTLHPHISVIIANYNGGDYLRGALLSLQAQTYADFDIYVIDNASSDDSLHLALAPFGADPSLKEQTLKLPLTQPDKAANLHVFSMSKNLGFAAANNFAARKAQGKLLALLNPDAEAAPTWLETLVGAAQRHPEAGMFASAQISLHEPDLLDGAGDAYYIFGIPWRGGFGRPVAELPSEGTCFSPCGASGMFKRDLFLAHGGFEERFFCYCEDVDLGFRLRLAGEYCVFVPTAIVHHAGSGVTGRESDFSSYHGARNRFWTYIKNMPLRILIPTLPIHAVLILAILFRNRKNAQNRATIRGLRDAVLGMGPFLRERRALKRRRKTRVIDIIDAMCWDIHTMRKRKAHIRPLLKR